MLRMKKLYLFLKKYNVAMTLVVIFSIGVFLRAYNFHDWLLFELDQVRDASLVDRVLQGTEEWPLLGPTMRGSGETKETLFRVGPIYPYFQIVSAKIFGSNPDALAYPDFFFSVFSIPLLYLFLKRYFVSIISLELTGLYAISFFSIQYSRFAWNPNSIPFFVLLFLISLHEFFVKREKVSTGYGIMLGLALGIGVQLHAISLVVFSVTATVSSVFLLKRDWRVAKKLFVVFSVAVCMNIPQIFGEMHTGFANTRTFFNSPMKEEKGAVLSWSNIMDTAMCHVEANTFAISSLGEDSCDFSARKLLKSKSNADYFLQPSFLFGFFLSLFGLALFVRRWRLESDCGRKSFLTVIFLFLSVSFLLMLSVISSGFREFRYFSIVFFFSYVLLGCIFEFFLKMRSIYISKFFLLMMGIFLVSTNFFTIQTIARELLAGEGSDGHSVYLGEVEKLSEYVIQESDWKNEVNLVGKPDLLKNIFRPMEYVTLHRGFVLNDVEKENFSSTEIPSFYISKISKSDQKKNVFFGQIENSGGFPVEHCEAFGKMLLCKIRSY